MLPALGQVRSGPQAASGCRVGERGLSLFLDTVCPEGALGLLPDSPRGKEEQISGSETNGAERWLQPVCGGPAPSPSLLSLPFRI